MTETHYRFSGRKEKKTKQNNTSACPQFTKLQTGGVCLSIRGGGLAQTVSAVLCFMLTHPQLCMEETRQAVSDMPPSPLALSPELLQLGGEREGAGNY